MTLIPWLFLVGLGADGMDGVSPAARALIASADLLVGGARHLALLPEDGRPRLPWPSPISAAYSEILRHRRQRAVCVLASGDPFCFGIGTTLARQIPVAEMVTLPAPSSLSLACARLGWGLPEVTNLSLHGRSLDLLHPALQPGARLLLLSRDGTTPAAVAALLSRRGYGPSQLQVFANMGATNESHFAGSAAGWDHPRLPDLNVIAVTCRAEPGAALRPTVPGLPDDAFLHDGQLTKQEMRAVTLAALAPVPGQRLWDVGAGCGSIAIEWSRHHPSCRATAFEPHPERRRLLAANASALGCPDIAIIAGTAPAVLDAAPAETPEAIFIGGGASDAGVLEHCWQRLAPGGRLVANVVTLAGEQALFAAQQRWSGRLSRLAVSRAEPLGETLAWRTLRPVTHYCVTKLV